ncbi:uncharacterized protein V6R79_015173, partial [Siganus canaliculatus]
PLVLTVSSSIFCFQRSNHVKDNGDKLERCAGGIRSDHNEGTKQTVPTLSSHQLALVLSEQKPLICHICIGKKEQQQ